ncbi:uncharacterized protein ACB058_014755 isoform 1-T1 [Synchiropus picturatus]
MFSDSRAPGEHRGFKPPHFIPWLRSTLKPHHGSDLGLNGAHKSNSELPNNLTPPEKPRGIGIFSLQGKKLKKTESRCNGMGMSRMLPVVLRGHHILPGSLGKQREESPVKDTELNPDPKGEELDKSSTSEPGKHTSEAEPNNHLSIVHTQHDGTTGSIRKYGPLVLPPSIPAPPLFGEETECNTPVVVCMEDRRRKVWDYSSHTIHQRDLHSSSWLSSDSQGRLDRQHRVKSSFSTISRASHSQRDLRAPRDPPVEAFNGPLSGVLFSTEVHHRGLGFTTTVRGPRKPRPSSQHITARDQNPSWSKGNSSRERRKPGCDVKEVRDQIKRVMVNLEQVLSALRSVQQEMKEVVQQIDNLTSSIDLDEEEQQWPGGGDSSSGEEAVCPDSHRPSAPEPGAVATLQRRDITRSRSPPNILLCPVTSGLSLERSQGLRFTCRLGGSPRMGRSLPFANSSHSSASTVKNPSLLQNLTSHEPMVSTQRSLPVRPPTPGLSPLTVNLQRPNSPGSQPHSSEVSPSIIAPPSSGQSPNPPPPPALSPSVIIETPQDDHQSSPSLPRGPSASCPPSTTQSLLNMTRQRRSHSAGPAHKSRQVCPKPMDTNKPAAAPGRRGRRPPPYPHHRLSEPTKSEKEVRKAPPYPEKRRLLSTTV